MEKVTVTSEELEKLKDFDKMENAMLREMGIISAQLKTLNFRDTELYQELKTYEENKSSFHKELTEKYGEKIKIDFETGEITKDENA